MKLIPLDKSWIIRMGVLDLLYGHPDIALFLNTQTDLSDDLLALKRACNTWYTNNPTNVGESATLYRFLQFASWKLNLNKSFIIEGTLKERKLNQDSSIINLSQQKLLNLPDEPTSQWASAAVLLGDKIRLVNAPHKLNLTYDAVDHWHNQSQQGKHWEVREDTTIRAQAQTFLTIFRGKPADFIPLQAEDYCFSRTFNYISKEDGLLQWPTLSGHESNRFEEMEKVMVSAKNGQEIISKDHRVIQAIVMWGLINKTPIQIVHPNAVSKSWPQFWKFIETAQSNSNLSSIL